MTILIHAQLATAHLRQRGSKPEVSECGDIVMNRECGCRVLLKLNVFLVRFLEFTVYRKNQLHLSQNNFFEVGLVLHKGVHIRFVI